MTKIFLILFTISIGLFAHSTFAYSNKHFKGSYAFRLVGPSSYVLANQPLTVGTGIFISDGKGAVSGHAMFRSAGISCYGDIVRGSYNLKPDGTGTLTSVFQTATPGCVTGVLDLEIVLADRGRVFEAATFANDYMAGTLTKQDQRGCNREEGLNESFSL